MAYSKMDKPATLFIFVQKVNQRLVYTANEFFKRRMGVDFEIVTNETAFESFDGFKLNYSSAEIEGIPSIVPASLLFEKRIHSQELDAFSDDGVLKLFQLKHNSLGYDPLAASFFFLSRYEEYLLHRKDEHDRFLADEFLVVKEKAECSPLVEIYVQEVAEWLMETYSGFKPDFGKPRVEITIDVDQVFALKSKGLARSILASLSDLLRGKLLARLRVMFGLEKDPNDVYDHLISICEKANVNLQLFIQVGGNSRFDVNNPPHLAAIKQRITELSLSAKVGLHPSYYSSDDDKVLLNEMERLRNILAQPIKASRQHYLRFRIPNTFRQLDEMGVKEDYSFGFTDRNGFRASTCKPFRFYDLQREEVLEIKMIPIATMDLVSTRVHHDQDLALKEMKAIWESVSKVGGLMVTMWHPEVLNGLEGEFASFSLLEDFLKDV